MVCHRKFADQRQCASRAGSWLTLLLFLTSGSAQKLLRGFAEAFGALLAFPHRRVVAAAREQRVMRPALDNDAIVQHQDLVGIDDRGQSMSNDQCRAACGQLVQARLNLVLRV